LQEIKPTAAAFLQMQRLDDPRQRLKNQATTESSRRHDSDRGETRGLEGGIDGFRRPGQVSKLSPPGNNGARAVQRDAAYERRSRTPAWSTNRLRDKAFSALRDRLRFALESLDEAERARKH
jgi:hypothetical protein